MQVTKGTWRMREQCVPGSLSSSPAREPGNEARSGGAVELFLHLLPHSLLSCNWHCRLPIFPFHHL